VITKLHRRPQPTPRTEPIPIPTIDPDDPDPMGTACKAWIAAWRDEAEPLPHVPARSLEREQRWISEQVDAIVAKQEPMPVFELVESCGHRWPDGLSFTEEGTGYVCTLHAGEHGKHRAGGDGGRVIATSLATTEPDEAEAVES
jgi:hypothetical protein